MLRSIIVLIGVATLSGCANVAMSPNLCQSKSEQMSAHEYVKCISSLDDQADDQVEKRYRSLGYPLK